ncbi:hypothetical protein Dsin_023426 [Dipteronia sinensis]|uniref:No apical meristem-associated C-terminal domain-containing protein n=1 Tax=Dipteronia sinensis TaxID=43782 RepID=A0AAE0A4S1_9ROSI|nr:hypothetical protein Dsin_023426 [Dipteronia sinensis]
MEENQNVSKCRKSFTNNQDVAICNAWLAITQDPIVSNLLTSQNFWDRVLENYTIHANDQSLRTKTSIQSRSGTIMRSCNKFHGYLSQIENRQQSGMTGVDKVPETPNSQDSNHLPFENTINDLNKRPISKKAEKELGKKKLVDASSTRLCDLMFEFNMQTCEAQERKAHAEERKLQILEEANEREKRKAEMELKIMMEKHEREQ